MKLNEVKDSAAHVARIEDTQHLLSILTKNPDTRFEITNEATTVSLGSDIAKDALTRQIALEASVLTGRGVAL